MAMQERKLPMGKIEPNTGKYFVNCALGGIIGRLLRNDGDILEKLNANVSLLGRGVQPVVSFQY